jgi:hypothetical protein
MRLHSVSALAMVVALGSIAAHATAVDTAQRAMSTVVVVTEDGGQGVEAVTDIAPESLTVRVNGIATQVVGLEATPPLSLVLLLDVTSSMSEAMASFVWDGRGATSDMNPSGHKPPDSPSALWLSPITRGFLRGLAPSDRVRIGRIAQPPAFSPDFTSDRSAIQEGVRRMLEVPAGDRYSETPIWDALDTAVAALEHESGRRRAILLATDGLSTGNRLGLDTVLDRATRADVAIFVIGEAWRLRSPRGWSLRIGGPWILMSGPFGHTPWSHLRRLAATTGGVFVPDGEEGWPEPERRLQTVMSLLRASRTLRFGWPLQPNEPGTVTVDVTGVGRQAHARSTHSFVQD